MQARTEFEETPDTGLIGKSCTRIMHLLYWYGVVLVPGLLLIGLGQPIFCVLVCVVCTTLALLWPILAPCLALVAYALKIVLLDTDSPYEQRTNWPFLNAPICCCFYRYVTLPLTTTLIFEFGLGGFGMLLWNLLILALSPVVAAVIVVLSMLRFVLASLWDCVIMCLVVRPRARVPSQDTFAAR